MSRVTFITSQDNPLLIRVRRLAAHPDAYRKQGKVWIEGEHLCRAWLARARGTGALAVIGETAWSAPAWRQLASAAEAVAVVPDASMAALSTLESPAALAFEVPWPGAGAVQAAAPSLVLDRVQDAGNVGTILRSAAAFGITQVIALKGTAALWSPKVMRSAMGAHFVLNLVESAADAALDALNVPLLATSAHTGEALHTASLPWPCAWVFGNEGQGLAPTLLERCARTLRIAQPGGVESLNVAVAASVCLYESARRRSFS